MGRFDWLEIPSDKNKDNAGPPSENLKPDERFDPPYYLEMANRFYYDGNFDEALKHYSRVLHIDRENLTAWIGQSKCLVKIGELNEAKIWVEKALSMAPADPELLSVKAYLLMKSGIVEDAMACSDMALKGAYNSPYIWIVRGLLLLAQNNGQLSRYCFYKAEEAGKNEAGVFYEIADHLMENGAYILAVDYFKKAVDLNPQLFLAWTQMGQAFEKLDQRYKAQFAYERALEVKPKFAQAANRLFALKNRKTGFMEDLKRFFTGGKDGP